MVVASVARSRGELNYKDMGALSFVDNLLWPIAVYYARGLNSSAWLAGVPSSGGERNIRFAVLGARSKLGKA